MPASRIFKCGLCKNTLGKTQGSIQCNSCKSWLHLTCANVSEKHLQLFNDKPNAFSFKCATCTSNGVSNETFVDDVKALKNSFDNFLITNRDDQSSFKGEISKLLSEFKNDQVSFKSDITQLLSDFKNEIAVGIRDMKEDIVSCNKLIKNVESSTSAKCAALEIENNVLHRRLNRADIIISGLPYGLSDLTSIAIAICGFFNIDVSRHDFHLVCFMNKKGKVLAKFNSVDIRDSVMREYFKTRSLKLNDIIGGEIESRVYLNDHFSPAASNLNMLCRRMIRLKIISNYKVLNADKPRAKITLLDNSIVIYDTGECAALLHECAGSSVN